jgi:phage gp37-like protein
MSAASARADMINPLGTVEDFLVTTLTAAFGATVKKIDTSPARLDDAELGRILHVAPGLFVSFLGGQRDDALPACAIMSRWGVYVVAANAAGETARRRGDGVTIGAFDMITRAVATLERAVVPGIGTLILRDTDNLAGAAFASQGRTVYGLVFTVPLSLAYGADALAPLPPFQTFEATWDLDTVTAATDTVLLPGATS